LTYHVLRRLTLQASQAKGPRSSPMTEQAHLQRKDSPLHCSHQLNSGLWHYLWSPAQQVVRTTPPLSCLNPTPHPCLLVTVLMPLADHIHICWHMSTISSFLAPALPTMNHIAHQTAWHRTTWQEARLHHTWPQEWSYMIPYLLGQVEEEG
jgi:hypothetical protein